MNTWPDWTFISDWALRNGVLAETVQKWRERRSVPHRYRLPMAMEAGRPLGFEPTQEPATKDAA